MGNVLAVLGFFGFLFSIILFILSISTGLLDFLASKFNIEFESLKKIKNHRLLRSQKNIVIMLVSSMVVIVVGSIMIPTDELADVESNVESVVEVQADEEEEVDEDKEKAEQERLEELEKEKEIAEKERDEEQAKKEEEKKKLEEEKRLEEQKQHEEEEKKRVEEEKEKELSEANPNKSDKSKSDLSVLEVPNGSNYVVVNNNIPYFTNEDISSTEVYHENGSLDNLGRATVANALVGIEIMPAEERGSIGHIDPSGWNQAQYAGIGSGDWLYNRSHLIGHQMTGNDDPENLMTGTRAFNMAMLEFENFVANYVETTENHVRYRVTPVFEGNNLVASGAYMEGLSIEDNGEEIMFNVYLPNRQTNVEINYANGSSTGPAGPAQEGEIKKRKESTEDKSKTTPPVTEPKKEESKPEPTPAPQPAAPAEDLASVDTNGNGKVTIQEAKDAGFSMPIYQDHWLYKYMDDRNNNGMVGE